MLRGLAADLPARDHSVRREVELSSGRSVSVTLRAVPGTGGVLAELTDEASPRPRVPRAGERMGWIRVEAAGDIAGHRGSRRPVLVCGEPGTGRSTTVATLAEGQVVRRWDTVELLRADAVDLVRQVAAESPEVVVVEDVHLLSPPLVAQVARLLSAERVWTVLTSAPLADLAPEHAALAARCLARIELPPLRARREEIPSLVRSFVHRLYPEARVRFTPQALEALAAHPWPGNLHELREVLRQVLEHRSAGDITRADLPPMLREAARTRHLSLVERAEYETILAALRGCSGNKVHAARRLGMSRATLYRRIRALGIDDTDTVTASRTGGTGVRAHADGC